MITKEQAIELGKNPGTIIFHLYTKNSYQTPLRARINGRCQTWKKRPLDFRLPIKMGLYLYTAITPQNAEYWTTNKSECRPPFPNKRKVATSQH